MSYDGMSEGVAHYRYKLLIEYNGNAFHGWQRQQNSISVQEVIENAIKSVTKESVTLYVAGRTDTGVHAFGQVAHFDLHQLYDPYKLTASINHFCLPHSVGILNLEHVDNDFHARFSAKKRHYVYKILNRQGVSIIENGTKLLVRDQLDHELMQNGANYLLGTHDFTSFRATSCGAKSPVRTISSILVEKVDSENIFIYVSAPSFLHHMVRNIVGSLLLVGKGKWKPEMIKEVLLRRDRKAAGPTAPAHGLYLASVEY
jgi:tRNA pseudouridine38-40 synthase